MIKRTKVDAGLEKQLLTGMVTSTPFLASCHGAVDTSLFPQKYCQQVADWCVSYFRQYAKAPGPDIEPMFHAWVANEKPKEDDADAVSQFLEHLSTLSDDRPEPNVPFLTAEMRRYMGLRGMEKLKDTLELGLARGEVDACAEALQNYRSPDLGGPAGYKFDSSALVRTFSARRDSVVTFGDNPTGEFFDQALTADSLIGLQNKEKGGKTFMLLEFAYRGLRCRRNVAIFQTGDLSESQLNMRLAVRMSQIPMWESQCRGVELPTGLTVSDGVPSVESVRKKFSGRIDLVSAKKGRREWFESLRLTGDELRISVHPNNSVNVRGIDSVLRKWKHEEGWVAEVIIVDYADILAPENNRRETRDQINETWQALRRLSQEWNACVITASQSNADSYGAKTQTMRNFSNDKRKYAHTTGFFAINQTDEEKEMQIARLNWLVLRESEFNPSKCLWVAQCLPLGKAIVKSSW